MKVLLINGSPKGTRSNSLRLATAFINGLGICEVETVQVSKLDIRPCLGCFSCWNKTPGKCCLKDDMDEALKKLLWADLIVWSFPLYYFSVPGPLKNLIDRQLPLVLPFMTQDNDSGGHPTRFDMSGKRHVVISTCGFHTAKGNYEGVTAMFDHTCGKDNYTAIFCGQGELFRVKELSARTDAYLSFVTQAAREYAATGSITPDTWKKLEEPLYPRDVFERMADASWGVEPDGEKTEEALVFTRQMAALYQKSAWKGKDIVLEMAYTDLGKTYQVLLQQQGSTVLTEGFRCYTTRIETPYSLWQAIAAGEISGEQAMMEQKYRVLGDFELMLHWDDYFGGGSSKDVPDQRKADQKSTNMNILLIPWITFWVAASIDSFWGALISIFVSAGVQLLYFKNRKTVYDTISQLAVILLSLLLILELPARTVVPLSYLCFGILWTVSAFLRIPLTAHYSMNDYNGEEALGNPLFVKTNRILTACWGVLYLLTPIWTYYIMGTQAGSWTGAINSVLPLLMGIFTGWFQKWYPARVARGK